MDTLFGRPQDLRHVRYVSHRGFQPLAPENSLPSFAYAGRLRQWAIETDVRFTRDGVAVCCHNDSTDAMYDEPAVIAQSSWAELSRLRLAKGNRLACFAPEELRMPRFSEYLAVCRKFGSIPFIELKTDDTDRVLRCVRDAGFADEAVVMSCVRLDPLVSVRRAAKRMFVHWIFAEEARLPELAALGNAGLSWNEPDADACPAERLALARDAGVRVCLRAGDTLPRVKTMLAMGLDYIPTNCMHGPD